MGFNTNTYEVIVGNLGTVLSCTSRRVAEENYADYVRISKGSHGSAAGEPVTLTKNGEPLKEYEPPPEELKAALDAVDAYHATSRLRMEAREVLEGGFEGTHNELVQLALRRLAEKIDAGE